MSNRLNNNPLLVALTSSALLTSILAIYYIHHRKKKTSSSSFTSSSSSSVVCQTRQTSSDNIIQSSDQCESGNRFCENGSCSGPSVEPQYLEQETKDNPSTEVNSNHEDRQDISRSLSSSSQTRQVSSSVLPIVTDLSFVSQIEEESSSIIESFESTADISHLSAQQESHLKESSSKVPASLSLLSSTEKPTSLPTQLQTKMQLKGSETTPSQTMDDSNFNGQGKNTSKETDIVCKKKPSCSSPEVMDESSNDSALDLVTLVEKELVIESQANDAPEKNEKKKKSYSKVVSGPADKSVKSYSAVIRSANNSIDDTLDSRGRTSHASGDSAIAASPDLTEVVPDASTAASSQNGIMSVQKSPVSSTDIGSPIYSDANSEGSSDSGKGNSTVNAFSQSNSPSSSQLHGNHVYQGGPQGIDVIHQFELPSDLVGRLIGKKGFTIKDIKAKSRANIQVYLHPFSEELRLCTIEGTRRNVEQALYMLRNLFPSSHYPHVTMHQVFFPEQISSPPTQVVLPMDVTLDVILSSMISAGHFFLQSPSELSYQMLPALDSSMAKSYSEFDTPLIPVAAPGMIVAAPIMGGWYRALIHSVSEAGQVVVKFVDYGGYSTLDLASLRQIRMDFMALPFQANECYLSDVAPIEGNQWSVETSQFFEKEVFGCLLKARVVGYTENGCTLIRLFKQDNDNPEKTIFINQLLVDNGFAVWINGSPPEGATCITSSCPVKDTATDDTSSQVTSLEPQPTA